MKLLQLIYTLLRRIVGSKRTTLAGMALLCAALALYLLDALHFDRPTDASIFTALVTAGTTLLLAKDV